MRRLSVRLAITIALPILFVFLCEWVLLPGVDRGALEAVRARGNVPVANLSVFALGLAPVVSAYFVVELVAAIVPSLARLRHGDPRGRAKLECAARIVALVLAVIHAWSFAALLVRLSDGSIPLCDLGTFSTPVVVFSLVGGVCAMFIAADFVSRQGIANGIVLFTTVSALVEAVRSLV